jgi:DNA-damage-inducible protein J
MPANSVVRARIDKDLKEEAIIGLTVSDAFRMMLMRVVAEKALPFDPLVPNDETIAAMRDARLGNVRSFETVDALMEDLNAPD